MEKIKGLQTKTINVELDKLKLDLNNVRFQHVGKLVDDKKMEELIWKESSTRELYEQIKAAGGLYEEPIIEEVESEYRVLEGNRRLVCVRRLQSEAHSGKLPGSNKKIFDTIKCRIIPKGTTEIQKRLYLASIHVKGKQPWPAFNKAKQIYDLYKIDNLSYDSLSKYLSMGKITIIKVVNAYEQTYDYGQKYPDDEKWYRKYTYFEELFRRRDLKEFSKFQQNVDRFAKWVHENKFSDAKDIRILARIIDDKDLMRVFENSGFKASFELLQEKDPILRSKEFKQIQKTIDAIRFFPRGELVKTVSDPHRKAIILRLKEEIDSLVRDITMLEKKEI